MVKPRSARSIQNERDTLRGCSETLGESYDRLRQLRLRYPRDFPTEYGAAGDRLHRPADVARFLSDASRGWPRTRTT